MIKLPKQWKHWCKKANLRIESKTRKSYLSRDPKSWGSLNGRGYKWRVNCHGMFQRGDSYKEFDRWARCSPIHEVQLPKTELEFLTAVKNLESKVIE